MLPRHIGMSAKNLFTVKIMVMRFQWMLGINVIYAFFHKVEYFAKVFYIFLDENIRLCLNTQADV